MSKRSEIAKRILSRVSKENKKFVKQYAAKKTAKKK